MGYGPPAPRRAPASPRLSKLPTDPATRDRTTRISHSCRSIVNVESRLGLSLRAPERRIKCCGSFDGEPEHRVSVGRVLFVFAPCQQRNASSVAMMRGNRALLTSVSGRFDRRRDLGRRPLALLCASQKRPPPGLALASCFANARSRESTAVALCDNLTCSLPYLLAGSSSRDLLTASTPAAGALCHPEGTFWDELRCPWRRQASSATRGLFLGMAIALIAASVTFRLHLRGSRRIPRASRFAAWTGRPLDRPPPCVQFAVGRKMGFAPAFFDAVEHAIVSGPSI